MSTYFPTFLGSVSVALTLRSIALAVLVVVAQILGRTPATIPILSMESWMWQSWQPGWVALEAAPWCWTQSTVLLPTLFGIGLDASLRRQLLELGDLAL